MALIIPNIGVASFNDPGTGVPRGFFSKMDSFVLDGDFKLTPQYGGAGMSPIAYTSADRKSKLSMKGLEVPLNVASTIVGGSNTIAAVGSLVQIPINKVYTIPTGGVLDLTDGDAISATVTTVYVTGASDNKPFAGVASAPTAGQFINGVASATTITFNTADADKVVYVSYTIDTSTGGAIHATASSMPNTQKLIISGKILSTEDPNSALVPITIVIPKSIFVGSWQVEMARQKASSTSIDLELMDPGGTTDLFTIYTAAKFAG